MVKVICVRGVVMVRPTRHKLLNPCRKICMCGIVFTAINHSSKYCSPDCRKRRRRNWSKIRGDFRKANPHLCSSCGCCLNGSKFRNCLQCRVKHRIYYKKYLARKNNGK